MHLTPLLPMLTILALARAENFDPAKNICPRGQLWIRRASDSKKMGCVSLAGGLAKPVAPKDDLPMIAQLVGFKRTGCGLFDVGYDPVVGSNEIYLTRRVTDGVRFCSAVSGGKLGCNVQKRGNGRVRGEAVSSLV
ncbi:MAG: hypothetical protein M1829_006365 [Trizodia sp. TS-e1964]|nr:MAG: hypothetical protein M1829_006365 [Trizodia sp. TS-e1964]